jgi:hypothetical protein
MNSKFEIRNPKQILSTNDKNSKQSSPPLKIKGVRGVMPMEITPLIPLTSRGKVGDKTRLRK